MDMNAESNLYNETVLDHFQRPRNLGDLPEANGVGEVGAVACGDIIKLSLKIQNERIREARFKAYGCGPAIASSSVLTEMLTDKNVAEAARISNQDILSALGGLPPVKLHCAVLAEEALKAALEDYHRRQGGQGNQPESNPPADGAHVEPEAST